eukprot:CAMPEP_0196825502 /NCGR_PEP_ID=MMETSP1362-20130617/93091_1 /TAXON_ID=163516 /ORGANISM="Leptocylindrus danicus, Strain CCMP1856" /LENGTH=337 /DNA_ID=CAMNT_0042205941 /DNA_START=1969 /DNA_END=2982 /DNA_ORIENTATION=-
MKKESTRLINKYTKQGLKVNEIFADNKFHPIIDANALIHVNLAAAGEHVGDIKNPNKVRISPSTIVEGCRSSDPNKLTLPFGTFVQLTINSNFPTNTVKQHTVDAICLGPLGNTQGTYSFMSLDTGRRLHGRSWKRCIPDQTVIERVHALGRKQRMPEMKYGPIVEHRPHTPLLPLDDDSVSDSESAQSDQDPPLLYHDIDNFSIQSDHTDIASAPDQGAQIIGRGDDASIESTESNDSASERANKDGNVEDEDEENASEGASEDDESDKRDVLYLKLAKALYGCLKSALLRYRLFKGTLEKMGFKLNRYDPCVANKVIKGKQCTIGWWVDDNFKSH